MVGWAEALLLKKCDPRFLAKSLIKETGARGHFHQVRVTSENVAIRDSPANPKCQVFFALGYYALTCVLMATEPSVLAKGGKRCRPFG